VSEPDSRGRPPVRKGKAAAWQNLATVRRRLVLLIAVTLLVIGPAGAQDPAQTAGATATAWGIHVTPAGGSGAGTSTVVAPPTPAPVVESFAYPADGSIVSASSSTVSASADVQRVASAHAESAVTGLSIFKGEITADAVTARGSAGTGPSGAGGNLLGAGVTNLVAEGQPVSSGTIPLADWGTLTVGSQSIDRSAPADTRGYRTFVTELDIHLNADHGGLPAGSEIQVGYADVAVHTAPPAPPPPTTTSAPTTTTTTPVTTPTQTAPPVATTTTTTSTPDVQSGDSPRFRKQKPSGAVERRTAPLDLQPKLTAGHYVFPVYGPVSYGDTFGAARSDVTYHHGDDIFGQLGQPLLAVADGTLFSVGWNKIGGNRLWLLDGQGNQFYYAHLSAYSTAAVNGARVKAGEVIGFMGRTGDAEGTPYHLHFEVHPVAFLYLGYDGAVDPTPYLNAWSHQQDLPFPALTGWAPSVPGHGSAPEPGAILLGMSDISTADGLDPASLRRALTPLRPSALMQTLVPTQLAPTKDLGKG
jgi:murein DD-endopeptidase MepM/ murein hydrolase activator NlpD